ncbi:uncharacterized protein BP5553_05417 [Venustampulla echinocandica]|uniref:Putative lipoate-protein ligase A n=1 Tax=Venustampulla echinocandica TaxID=2656787 RepID=A0A370TR45_9HELO|nr:uncharacterized protein BP5553_05417 [Venustampulla echinocandica]RDL37984.1 hypothetical protein BP5553_05417 [Venustampulla echinocandica]
MVVRALRRLGVEKARVNERHDIVVDTPGSEKGCLKVSGSAYKLTRLRSLHHGTCLLNSKNLGNIGRFLRSPAKEFIKARGVDSVSSPITNVEVHNRDFERAVIDEFGEMYETVEPIIVTEKEEDIHEVTQGIAELTSRDWIYGQTPQFTFTYPSNNGNSGPSEGSTEHASSLQIEFTARNAVIQSATLHSSLSTGKDSHPIMEQAMASSLQEVQETSLKDAKLHDIEDWESVLSPALKTKSERSTSPNADGIEEFSFDRAWEKELRFVAKNLNQLFGLGK